MTSYAYLMVNIGCIAIPFIASFYPKHAFYKEWKSLLMANVIVATFFLIWDIIFTHKGFWGFNEKYLIGVDVVNLPLEEILFFFCIPYACVFTYFSFLYLVKKNPLRPYNQFLIYAFSLIALFFMIYGYEGNYTFFTGLFVLAFLLYAHLKRMDLSYSFLAYFATLPFFFISNGILTGTGLESPIVWYNNAENLGVRMLTIPVEDSMYGFLLIVLNIFFFEKIRQKNTKSNVVGELSI